MNRRALSIFTTLAAKSLETWSGKRDSNLRPLPPEDAAPAGTRRFSVVSAAPVVLFRGAGCHAVHGARFICVPRPLFTTERSRARG